MLTTGTIRLHQRQRRMTTSLLLLLPPPQVIPVTRSSQLPFGMASHSGGFLSYGNPPLADQWCYQLVPHYTYTSIEALFTISIVPLLSIIAYFFLFYRFFRRLSRFCAFENSNACYIYVGVVALCCLLAAPGRSAQQK